MKRDEFTDGIKKLKDVFGERNYPPDRVNQLWDEFYKVSAFEFASAIAMMIRSERRPPLAPEIAMAVQEVRNRLYENKKQTERQTTGNRLDATHVSSIIHNLIDQISTMGKDRAFLMAEDLEKKTKYDCSFCENDGFIHTYRRADGYRIIFACPICEEGRNFSENHRVITGKDSLGKVLTANMPMWSDNLTATYEYRKKGF